MTVVFTAVTGSRHHHELRDFYSLKSHAVQRTVISQMFTSIMVRVKNRYMLLGHGLPTFLTESAELMLTIGPWVMCRYIILLVKTKDGRHSDALSEGSFVSTVAPTSGCKAPWPRVHGRGPRTMELACAGLQHSPVTEVPQLQYIRLMHLPTLISTASCCPQQQCQQHKHSQQQDGAGARCGHSKLTHPRQANAV